MAWERLFKTVMQSIKTNIDSTLENWSNDLVEELQGLIPVYGTWEDTPVTGNIVF